MSAADNLRSILSRQKEILTSFESEIKGLEENDLILENETLKKELATYKKLFEDEKSNRDKVAEENKSLKNSLYEQLYNEKIAIINATGEKAEVYYKSNVEGEMNWLADFEAAAKKRMDAIAETLKENRISLQDETYARLEELKDILNRKVTLAKEEYSKQTGIFHSETGEVLQKLKQEKLTEEQMKGRLKQNNLESLIGLNIINKLGILLLIIGVITASQFTYHKLPDTLKGIFAFTAGIILLVGGEVLNRKKPNVFSLGITSGGVAVLYSALSLSYFGLKILDMYPALILCVIITVGAFVLSQRYNSQTIASFALVGGYLPIFSIAGSKTLVYSSMIYFIVLNLLALIVSVNKKWLVSAYTGFVLNVGATGYIMTIMFSGRKYNAAFGADDLITLLYITFVFIIYTLIPITGTYFKKLRFKSADLVLLAANTVISALMLYTAFYEVNLSDYTGALAVIFAAVYLALGRFIETGFYKEKNVQALFYLTGFTFVILIIPFQFGKVWLSLGWLVEGVALAVYGILKEEKWFRKGGFVISAFCLSAFLVFDVTNRHSYLFTYKYLAITLGSLIILASYVYIKKLAGKGILLFKYVTTVNLWIFLMYIIGSKLRDYMSHAALADRGFSAHYLLSAAMVVVSFLLAYVIPRINILNDGVMKGISIFIYCISIAGLFILNFGSPVRGSNATVPAIAVVTGTIVLVMISLLSVLAVRDMILYLVKERKLGVEWYPIMISSYFVIILTQNLITQYHLEFTNSAISIIYVVTALSWIVFGFVKRYAFIRRFGLGLSMLAVAKLFVLDLSFLTLALRIVSYFAFGVTLIAISFVYQYFNKRLEVKGELMPDDKKNSAV